MWVLNDVITGYGGWAVCVVWLLEWAALLALSRFARWRAGRGHVAWENWALLPCYDAALVAKKVGMLAWLVCASAAPGGTGIDCVPPGGGAAEGTFLPIMLYCLFLGTFSYSAVMHALLAHSVGAAMMQKAVGGLLVYPLLPTILFAPEMAGQLNAYGGMEIKMVNATVVHPCLTKHPHQQPQIFYGWTPSFLSNGLPWDRYFTWQKNNWVWFWCVLSTVLGGVSAAVLITLGCVGKPRQSRLASGLALLFFACVFAHCFENPLMTTTFFDVRLFLIIPIIEAPLVFYVMLCDSRYWCNLSVDGMRSGSMDALSDKLVLTAAEQLMKLRHSSGAQRVPHLNQASLQVDSSLRLSATSGDTNTAVHRGKFRGNPVAIKSFLCKELQRDEIHRHCSEIMVANELRGHPNVVEHKVIQSYLTLTLTLTLTPLKCITPFTPPLNLIGILAATSIHVRGDGGMRRGFI